MKTMKISLALFLFTISSLAAQTEWKFDKSHSNVSFSVSHMVISETEGNFGEYDGTITSDGLNPESLKIDLEIKVASIDTDNEDRDKHLRSDDFFSAEKYPEIKFVSKKMTKVGGKKYKLVGDLTMKGVTKEVELDVKFNGSVKDPWGNERMGFKLSGEVNRFDYGLKWNKLLETGGFVVGEDVEIRANIELIKKG